MKDHENYTQLYQNEKMRSLSVTIMRSTISLRRLASMNNTNTCFPILVIGFTTAASCSVYTSKHFFFRTPQNARLLPAVSLPREDLYIAKGRNINVRVPITCVSLKRNVLASRSTLLCQIHIRHRKSALR